MLNFRNTLLAATMLLSVPCLAHAQNISGLYVGAGAGINFLQDEHIKGNSLPGHAAGLRPEYQPGWAGVGSAGYGFGNGMRLEVEGNYRTNHLRSNGPIRGTSDSAEQKYGAMVNALYDFNLADYGVNAYGATPYLGLGAGWVHNNWGGMTIHDGAGAVHVNNGVNDLAYQAIVGVAFPVTSVPGLSLTAEYRFVDEPGARKYPSAYASSGGSYTTQTKGSGDLNHSILLGVRYAFNAPVAAAAPPTEPPMASAAPVAAPAPSRSYLMFFDWDKADLSARAQQIIADAAQNATKIQYTRIDVEGHADLTGTHAYNQTLSMRRAEAVAAELMRDGVPQTAIVITASGDTKPLIPTAPGVREPQNRRVEIVIH
jgi:OOP family OmpA-OmpF porin